MFVRLINNMGSRESVNQALLADMSMLHVQNRKKQLRLNHVFKIVNNRYLLEIFTIIQQKQIYTIPECPSKCFDKGNVTF